MLRALLLVVLASSFLGAASLRCVFLHGVGEVNTSPPTPTDTEQYWGGSRKLSGFLGEACNSTSFVHQDSTTRAWDNAELQAAYCDAVVGAGGDLSASVDDALVVSHSMGNLIFADALNKGTCKLGPSSRWISLAAPWRGSKAAIFIEKLCLNATIFEAPLRWIAKEMNYCTTAPNGTHSINAAYVSLRPDNPALASGELAEYAAAHVAAAQCGDSAYGLTSIYSLALESLAAVVGYGESNDGMVPISSCQIGGKNYSGNYSSNY
jgi:hypothetical protein